MNNQVIKNFIVSFVAVALIISAGTVSAWSAPVIYDGTVYPSQGPGNPTPPPTTSSLPTTYYNPPYAGGNNQVPMYTIGNPSGSQGQIVSQAPTTYYNPPIITGSVYASQVGSGNTGTTSGVAMTTIGSTGVGSTGATLSGSWNTAQIGTPTITWFEYGTSSTNLNRTTTTSTQNNSTGTFTKQATNLTPNTIYYYRAVGQANGRISYGALRSFRTDAQAQQIVNTAQASTIALDNGPLIQNTSNTLLQSELSGMICPSDAVDYTLTYENKTGKAISNATLTVVLPNAVDYVQSTTQANYNANAHTVTIFIGSMQAGQSGVVYLTGRANSNIVGRDVSTRIEFTYTNANGVNEVVASTVTHSGRACENTLGAFAGGSGFFPTSFWGWLLIVILLCTIIYLSRKFFADRPVHGHAPQH